MSFVFVVVHHFFHYLRRRCRLQSVGRSVNSRGGWLVGWWWWWWPHLLATTRRRPTDRPTDGRTNRTVRCLLIGTAFGSSSVRSTRLPTQDGMHLIRQFRRNGVYDNKKIMCHFSPSHQSTGTGERTPATDAHICSNGHSLTPSPNPSSSAMRSRTTVTDLLTIYVVCLPSLRIVSAAT